MRLPPPPAEQPLTNVVVVPIARLNRPAFDALRYARSLSDKVTAVHVVSDPARTENIEAGGQRRARSVPLTIIESPYRCLARPLLQ